MIIKRNLKFNHNKFKLFISYIIIQLFTLSIVLFIRNELLIYKIHDNTNENNNIVIVDSTKAVVKDCYCLSRNEIYEVSVYINNSWLNMNIHSRSIQSIVSEIELHKLAYQLGIAKSHSKDADIETNYDPRLYVRIPYKTIQVLGI